MIELISLLLIAIIVGPSLIWFLGIVRWKYGSNRAVKVGILPAISVIVAGRNEADYIAECLQSLLKLDYPSDRMEVLFVDDHSTDSTKDIATQIAAQTPGNLIVLSAPDEPLKMGSKKRALTHAIEHSKGEILLFCDADNRVLPQWARMITAHFCDSTGAVTGAAIPEDQRSAGLRLYRMERLMVAVTAAAAIGLDNPGTACGQNLALRKVALLDIGGYAFPDIPSGDDDLTVQAISRAGWTVRFAATPASVVHDQRAPSLSSHTNAAVRHQSVTHLYPVGLRILYAASILSGTVLVVILASTIVSRVLLPVLLISLFVKGVLDVSAVTLFKNKLGIRLSVVESVVAEILLPFYLALRPLFRIKRGFVWRGAKIKQPSRTVTGSAR